MIRKYLAAVVALATLAGAGTVPVMARSHRADPPAGRHLYNYAPGGLGSPNLPDSNDNPAFTGGGNPGYNQFVRKHW